VPLCRSILVLCEGNHCRSPIAEGLLRVALGEPIQVSSAGLGALVGHPAHPEAQKLMAEHGLDISSHQGRQLTPELALRSDLILVMDEAQKTACELLAPAARGRIFLLGHWLPGPQREIIDPIQRSPEFHRQVHDHIQLAVSAWLPRLNPAPPRTP